MSHSAVSSSTARQKVFPQKLNKGEVRFARVTCTIFSLMTNVKYEVLWELMAPLSFSAFAYPVFPAAIKPSAAPQAALYDAQARQAVPRG